MASGPRPLERLRATSDLRQLWARPGAHLLPDQDPDPQAVAPARGIVKENERALHGTNSANFFLQRVQDYICDRLDELGCVASAQPEPSNVADTVLRESERGHVDIFAQFTASDKERSQRDDGEKESDEAEDSQ